MTALEALRCPSCEAVALPHALACHRCGARGLAPVTLDPAGTIHASTPIRVAMPEADGTVPAANPIAVVALDGGPFVLARLDEALADARPPIRTPVRVEARDGVLWAVVVGV